MTRIRYSEPGRPVFCSATNRDGRPCGNKVGVSGAVCGVHRRVAERKHQEKLEAREYRRIHGYFPGEALNARQP